MSTEKLATTIAAVATPPGRGAIAIVRVSGPLSHAVLTQVFSPCAPAFTDFSPWVLHRGRFRAADGAFLDDVLAVFMPAPKTYTGEEMGEIQCHGSPVIVQAILDRLFQLGVQPADPGAFSKRAFLNGRMDISQAEAVAEVVAAQSPSAVREAIRRLDGLLSRTIGELRARIDSLRASLVLACDFPEEEVDCLARPDFVRALDDLARAISDVLAGKRRTRLYHEGARVLLLGAVNAGKSRLLNAFLGHERALVTDIPGTTRDYLEESCFFEDLPVRLVDTAGIRETLDPVEQLGIARGMDLCASADCLLLLLDATTWQPEDLCADVCPDPGYARLLEQTREQARILVVNKCDLVRPRVFPPRWCSFPALCVSAHTGEGLSELASRVRATILGDGPQTEYVSVNLRQSRALECALRELAELRADVLALIPYDLCAVRLEVIAKHLGDVIGLALPSEVLNDIFDRFCLGK